MAHYEPRHHQGRPGSANARWAALLGAIVVALVAVAVFGSLGGGHHSSQVRSGATTGKTSPTSGTSSRSSTAANTTPTTSVGATTRATAVSAPFSVSETAAWVAAENAKPGTSAWKLTQPDTDHQIEGFADVVSVEAGGPVQLFVSTSASSYTVQAFRMGWYGGAEGRLLWASPTEAGVAQPACPLSAATRTTACTWQSPVTVSTAGWPQGDYLFKLSASSGYQSYIPLTVRDDASHSAYLVNSSVTTWQAYNLYGGYDLYQGPSGSVSSRAYAVSFDRPYQLNDGAADFIGLELPMVSTMESHDLDVSYTTDIDLAANPSLVLQHKAFISLGHDEYYSLSMRNGLEAARNAGVNLVFLGANAVYRHIRLQSSPLGPNRLEIDYKDPSLDPLDGKDDADVTPWAWRAPPNNNPESELLGEMWQCNPVRGDMVVTDANWMFTNSGLSDGSHIPGIVGPEYDSFSPYAPNPGDVTVVAASPVTCEGRAETANMTYYSFPSSKAGVWDTGTIDWVGSVGGNCATCAPPNDVTWITDNVLAAFGTGPAGSAHPSTANEGGNQAGTVTTTTLPLSLKD